MDKRIEFVLKYLDENLGKKVTLKKLSEMVNLSCGYLSELFTREVGITFSFYMKKIRIDRAKSLLEKSFLSVKEISFETGYRDVSNFCRDFKELEKISPSEYRNKMKVCNDFDQESG